MLERHYSKFKVEDRAADFSGLAHKRKKAMAREQGELVEAKKTINTLNETIQALNQTIAKILGPNDKSAD
jgi:hypothetical protein